MNKLPLLLPALFFLVSDQLHKWYMLEIVEIANRPPITVTSFFNLVMVWNPGISFGMFQNSEYSRYIFTALALVIVIILTIWLFKTPLRLERNALNLIIGGALGNVIDRIRFGAVADFFDVHVMGYHWPAFNIADACIFIGAMLLAGSALFGNHGTEQDNKE